jgi:hypothetical protein
VDASAGGAGRGREAKAATSANQALKQKSPGPAEAEPGLKVLRAPREEVSARLRPLTGLRSGEALGLADPESDEDRGHRDRDEDDNPCPLIGGDGEFALVRPARQQGHDP